MAVPLLALAGIQAGAGILDTLIQGMQSRKNIRMEKQANLELARYAYSKDLEMWNLANKYNSPEEVRARLESAGLNPNLVYGSGQATTPAQTIPKFQAPRIDYQALPPIQFGSAVRSGLEQFNDFRVKNAQVDLLKEQIRQTKINALFTARKSEHELTKGDISFQKAGVEYARRKAIDEMLKYQLEAMRLKNQKTVEETSNLVRRGILSDLDIDWYQYKKLLPAFMGLGAGLFFKGSQAVPRFKSVLNKRYNPGQTPAMRDYKPIW